MFDLSPLPVEYHLNLFHSSYTHSPVRARSKPYPRTPCNKVARYKNVLTACISLSLMLKFWLYSSSSFHEAIINNVRADI